MMADDAPLVRAFRIGGDSSIARLNKVGDMEITVVEIASFAEAVKQNSTSDEHSLGGNEFGDEGAAFLGQAISKSNCFLKHLFCCSIWT